MKLLVAALAALQSLEHRFHDLVDPQGQIAKGVRDVAVATAEHVKALEARLASLELAAGIAQPSLITQGEDVTMTNAAGIGALVVEDPPATPPPSTVIPIPVAPELLVTDPGPG